MQTTASLPSVRSGNRLFCIGFVLFAICYLAFYPQTFAIVDEDAYLTQAYLFRSGRLSYDDSDIPSPHMTVDINNRMVSKYPPGNSLFLVVFILLGWKAAFASGLVLALAGTLLLRGALRMLDPESDPALGLLYLFYPAVVLMSRTLMSDLLTATLVLAGFVCLLKKGGWLLAAGLALGAACLVRYSTAVLVPVFAILAAVTARQRFRAVVRFGLGLLPFGLAIMAWNSYAFGSPLGFPMFLTGHFWPGYFFRNLAYYGINLLVLYPLMLILPPFTGQRTRLLLSLPAYSVLLLYCFFSYLHAAPSLPERLTLGVRYLLPALPFFVLGSALTVDRLSCRIRGFPALKYALLGLMFVMAVAVHFRHHTFLDAQDADRRTLYARVPADALLLCNTEVSELISYPWGWRDYRHLSCFNAPLPLPRDLDRRSPLYAALLTRPERSYLTDEAMLVRLRLRYPEYETVYDEEGRFRILRLRP